ncbi:hypothetical protein STEG23_007280 [Scotinomys teguina]
MNSGEPFIPGNSITAINTMRSSWHLGAAATTSMVPSPVFVEDAWLHLLLSKPPEQQDSATFKMLHHKKEDENLWIASRLIWFDQPRPPDSSQTAPVKIGPSS